MFHLQLFFIFFSYSIVPTDSIIMDRFSLDPVTGHLNTTVMLDREQRSVYQLVIQATDTGRPALTGTTKATVYVADLNDNRPLFDFPRPENNTVLVSPSLHLGSVFARVVALDNDIGANANITYTIISGNHLNLFSMELRTGKMSLNKSLADYEDENFSLEVMARDNRYETSSYLYISVNQSIAMSFGQSAMLSGHNFIVVVVLAAVSGAVMLFLIAAIITIHRGRRVRNKREGQYNCRRAESTRRVYESAVVKPDNSWHGLRTAKKTGPHQEETKTCSFSTEVEAGINGLSSTKSWASLHKPGTMTDVSTTNLFVMLYGHV